MKLSQLLGGCFLLVLGLLLLSVPFIFRENGGFVTYIYAVPMVVLGIFLLANNKEDSIEQIRK